MRHRVAAVHRYDDELADELERMADVAHRGGDYRSAATLLRWARGVTRQRSERERRWLDGLFEAVLARDLAEVSGQLPEIAWATEAPRRALVQGALRMAEKRWLEAGEAFESVAPQDLCASDPLTCTDCR